MTSSGHYEIAEVTVPPRLVAGVRARVTRGHVAQEFGRHLDQVYAAARSGAVKLDGQNIFIYRDGTPDELLVEFCVGATKPFAAVGAVEPLYTPAGAAVMTTHWGPYSGLAAANVALREWARANNRVLTAPSWEVYGHWHEDPAQLRTDVYYLLPPDARRKV